MSKRVADRTPEPPFSPLLFIFTVATSLSVFLATLAFISPRTWRVQISADIPAVLGTILVMHFVNAFVEYFFHRYVLHAPLVPFLGYFYRQHTLHHSLTRVVQRRVRGGGSQEEFVNENIYPIEHEAQREASFFPWYTFGTFATLWTPFLMLAQRLLPAAPIFLGGFAAIALSLFLYEVLHAIEHLPLKKWESLLADPRFGRWWRMCYAFHLRHHADIKCNESISGFIGFPVAEILLIASSARRLWVSWPDYFSTSPGFWVISMLMMMLLTARG